MWADVKSILLMMVLLGAGPALAMEPDQAAPMAETVGERTPGPSWAEIPDFRPEGPLLGQDFNHVMEQLWEDLQRRQAERNAEIGAACREVRFVMGYLRDRVPQQIDEVRRQMAAHPKALQPTLSGRGPESLRLKNVTEDDDYLPQSEATLDQIRAGNNDYRNDYEGRLKHYFDIDLADYLDPTQDHQPITQGELLHHATAFARLPPKSNWIIESIAEFLPTAHHTMQEVLDMLHEVRLSLGFLERGAAQGKAALPHTEDAAPLPGQQSTERDRISFGLPDGQPVSRRTFIVYMMEMIDIVDGGSYTFVVFCGDYRGLSADDLEQQLYVETEAMIRALDEVNLEILTLARELGYR